MDSNEIMQLGREFVGSSDEEWRLLAEKALKGRSFQQALVHETYDGIAIDPLYKGGEAAVNGGYPGFFPFVRGFGPIPADGLAWRSRQRFWHPDPGATNAQILKDLEGGVTSLGIVFDRTVRQNIAESQVGFSEFLGDKGGAIHGLDDLTRVLASVHVELVEVSLEAGMGFWPAALSYLTFCEQQSVPKESVCLAVNADPIGALASGANISDTVFDGVHSLSRHLAEQYPNATCLTVNSSAYHGAGASNVQELGICLATGVSYLKQLVEAGLPLDSAFNQIRFTLPVDADLFASAAKLRALRLLWAHIGTASGQNALSTQIHAATSHRMLTKYDPWVNILRSATAGFASVLGGADCITIEPFDTIAGIPSQLGRRIARNTHTILAEESMLTKVVDPAGGSWYLESLTQELANRGWQEFQSIEKNGGIVSSLNDGSIAKSVSEVRKRRSEDIARRIEASVGVSEFPNLNEDIASDDIAPLEELRQNLKARFEKGKSVTGVSYNLAKDLAQITDGAQFLHLMPSGEQSLAEPFVQYRDAAPFEALREASDKFLETSGTRPRIFLANWGTPAVFTARATFAMNLFEAGGIEAVNNEGFNAVDELAAAVAASGAQLVVICSSDEEYVENGEALTKAIVQNGVARLYLAGRPQNKEELMEAGVDECVYAGMNVLEVLTEAHNVLGVN